MESINVENYANEAVNNDNLLSSTARIIYFHIGFVIQAVDADSPNKVVGSFVGASSGTKTLSCQSGSQVVVL